MRARPITLTEYKLDWLKDLRGHTYNQRLVDQAFKYIIEEKKRAFANIRGRTPGPETCLVTAQDRFKQVTDIGGSLPSDLVLDNFGTWLAALIRAPVNATITASLTDSGGTARSTAIYTTGAGGAVFNYDAGSGSLGTQLQVGSSSTAPARTDYVIGTAFGGAPESGLFDTGTGSSAAGVIAASGSIVAGAAITVRETGFYARWYSAAAVRTLMLFHDAVTETVFAAGAPVTVQWTITL